MSLDLLTDLQHAVLAMTAIRCPEATIASYLYLDRMQVRRLMRAACTRMDVRLRDQAIGKARDLGLLDPAGLVLP
jgi:DNA-binding CsgD family transcriptional regulator